MLFNPYNLLFLPATSGLTCLPGVPASVHRKIMAEISHSSVEEVGGIARCSSSPKSQIPRKLVFFWGVWEFAHSPGRARCPLSTGYPQLNVDNYCGVWELEGLPRNYYKCANPLTLNALAVQRCSLRVVQILSLLVQPLPQLVLRF